MMGTEFYLGIFSEQLSGKLCQGSLKVCKGDMLVDHQSLDLVEGGGMGGIHFIGAEYTSRSDHTDRRLLFFHDPGLYRRGLAS